MAEEIYIKKQLASGGHRFVNASWANDLVTIDLTNQVVEVAQNVTADPLITPMFVDLSEAQTRKPGVLFVENKNIKETITIRGVLTGPNATETKNKLIACMQMGGPLDEFKWREEVFNAANFNQAYMQSLNITDAQTEGTSNLLGHEVFYRFSINLLIFRIEEGG